MFIIQTAHFRAVQTPASAGMFLKHPAAPTRNTGADRYIITTNTGNGEIGDIGHPGAITQTTDPGTAITMTLNSELYTAIKKNKKTLLPSYENFC